MKTALPLQTVASATSWARQEANILPTRCPAGMGHGVGLATEIHVRAAVNVHAIHPKNTPSQSTPSALLQLTTTPGCNVLTVQLEDAGSRLTSS